MTLAQAMCAMRFDADQFSERAAICEFCGGMTRFDAETHAAKEQGIARWQALKEMTNADGQRAAGVHGNQGHTLARQRDADGVSGVQRASQEEKRSMPEREQEAGRDSGVLLALRMDSGEKK